MLHVVEEGKRCLQCKRPQCRPGCPVSTDIPRMIHCFLNNKIDEAGQMLFDNNPLSAITSLVCDHMNQCVGHCILQRKDGGVHIGDIEHYISARFLERYRPEPVEKVGKRAAVIGSGPAGMTIAILLARKGYDITIFDQNEKIGGVMRYGIPEFRLPKSILDRYHAMMESMGIMIRPNTTIGGGAISMDDLFRDGYLAVFIGTGVWRPRTVGIKGESLGNAHYGIDYLKTPSTYKLGNTVSVIGAGNAAIDVARTAVRTGSRDVTIYARGNKISASPHELEMAKVDGVRVVMGMKPLEITPEGTIFRPVTFDAEGKGTDHPEDDHLITSDSVIMSIGQGPRSIIVKTTTGIEVNNAGLVITKDDGQTTRPGVFASGDVVSGARTVVEAVQFSKGVVTAMDEYMQTL